MKIFYFSSWKSEWVCFDGRWNQEIQALIWISAPATTGVDFSAQVLSAKLWQHQHTKPSVKSEQICHLSAEFTAGLINRKEFSTKTLPWSLNQEKAQEINGRGNAELQCSHLQKPHLGPHSTQLPFLHSPKPPIHKKKKKIKFQTHPLSPRHPNFRIFLFPFAPTVIY